MHDTQNYLTKYYYTLEQLALKSQISKEVILELIEARCVPPHSFEVHQAMWIYSPLREGLVDEPTIRYYHRSLLKWLSQADRLSKTHALPEVATRVYNKFIGCQVLTPYSH